MTAQLAGRTFEQFVLDVGFSDPIMWTPDTLSTSGLLAFAGIDPIDVPAVPIAIHLAEKVHAYTRTYAGERASTRPKDLVDILIIAATQPVEARELGEALDRTFAGRNRHKLPVEFPPPPESWDVRYRDLAAEVEVEPDLNRANALARRLFDPVLRGEREGRWDPASWTWR